MKICLEIQIWLISYNNVGHFTRRPNCLLLLPGKLNGDKSALFELEMVSGYYGRRRGVEFVKKRQNVTFYVHSLLC